MKYNEAADSELSRVYGSKESVRDRIKILDDILGGESHFYSTGNGEITDEMKLGCLEYEYLMNLGLIEIPIV